MGGILFRTLLINFILRILIIFSDWSTEDKFLFLRLLSSFSTFFLSLFKELIFSKILFSLVFNNWEILFIILYLSFINFTAASPVMASILLIPEETEFSLIIFKNPISPVLLTWVPPHNSIDQKDFFSFNLSPIETTLTKLPYFSPNSAVAPSFLESSIFISRIKTSVLSRILLLIIVSISNRSSSLIELVWLKSNLSFCELTSEPFWEIWLPRTSFKAWCKIWVDEWLHAVKLLFNWFTEALTLSPIFNEPELTIISWR